LRVINEATYAGRAKPPIWQGFSSRACQASTSGSEQNVNLSSSWLRQWIEHVYQPKADAKDQLCPRSMFGKPIRRLAFQQAVPDSAALSSLSKLPLKNVFRSA
jgi:hypothetical protein